MSILPVFILVCLVIHLAHATTTCKSLGTTPNPSAAAAFAGTKFDYLVVGGGTAGLVIAERLTENPAVVVGVIEAGFLHLNDPIVDVPEFAGEGTGNPLYDWDFLTAPQLNAGSRVLSAPRGKMLGGSSGLNDMAWDRGAKADYDAWVALSDGDSASSWGWEGILPYLMKAERFASQPKDPFPSFSTLVNHDNTGQDVGTSGPITATLNTITMGDVPSIVKSWNALNVSTVENPYAGEKTGVYNVRISMDHGVRSYAASGYYCPASHRTNLHVITQAQATRVLFSNDSTDGNATATGVEFIVSNQTFTSTTSNEIILTAGSVGSPQLLELSGIGNATLLKNLGIVPLVDLPGVGENLQDHFFVPLQFQLKPGVQTFDELRFNETFAGQQSTQYNATHTGFFAATDSAFTFIPLQSYLNATAISSILASANTFSDLPLSPLQKAQFAIQVRNVQIAANPQIETIHDARGFFPPLANVSYLTLLSGPLHPFSRGSIHINSTDGLVPPVIDPNYLSSQYDVDVLVTLVELGRELLRQTLASSIVQTEVLPASNVTSTPDLESFVRSTSLTAAHLSCTAPMASRSLGGVVDPNLVVYGTKNLRIADSSIMPLIISGHLQATTYAIAEKAADMIKHS